ncbi:MAG: 2-dehydro-3-deoxyglucarate aldolase [Armatimonadetes bacterium]|nr:2-dehydro-3-deoxyglucarate aldolase [Armatimonadota bacterium]
MRANPVKAALRAGQPSVGSWLSLASPMAARFMARAGFPWLTVDIEHSPVDWETASIMFGCVADAGCVPLARVPSNDPTDVKRALDSGAYGIVFPMVNTVEEAEQAVAAAKYAPLGRRSVGGALHALNFGAEPSAYYARANDEILVVIQAEHIRAVENCEAIFAVPGIDAMFVGPNDLMSSLHITPALESDDPRYTEAIAHLLATAQRCGIAPGMHVGDTESALRRVAEGWRFVAVASELAFMMQMASEVAALVHGAGGMAVRY